MTCEKCGTSTVAVTTEEKTSDVCLRPLHDNGTLVPGSAQFVATRRSSYDRATVTVTRNDPHAYCVTLMA